MPVLGAPPPEATASVSSLHGLDETYQTQGPEGICVAARLAEVFAHWQRTESAHENGGLDADAEYHPIPPEKIVSMRARFRYVGEGKPLPYRLTDDE
jgi:hypothetical protein